MEIKIDTKKDSADDIRKAIELLQRIVESSGGGSYGSKIGTGSDVSNGMAGLFGDTPVTGSASDDESKDEEEEKQDIQIIPY